MGKAEIKTYHGMEVNNFPVDCVAGDCQVAARISGYEILMG